jgi:hypothetical protein
MMTRLDVLLVGLSANVALAILLKVTLALAAALAAVHVARRRPAAVRHAVLLAAFAALVALPVMATVAPAMTVAVPITALGPSLAEVAGDRTNDLATASVADVLGASTEPAVSAGLSAPSLGSILVAVWGLGAALCLVPILAGLWQVARLRRAALPWVASPRVLASIGAAHYPAPLRCGELGAGRSPSRPDSRARARAAKRLDQSVPRPSHLRRLLVSPARMGRLAAAHARGGARL